MIARTKYLKNLLRFKDKQLIKVVTGIRRCGKSTLFELYQEYLLQNGVDRTQIIAINLEDGEFFDIDDYRKLYDFVRQRLLPDRMNYIFLDEIQQIKDFQRVVDALYIKKNCDLYITGSNAYLLSGAFLWISPLPEKAFGSPTGGAHRLFPQHGKAAPSSEGRPCLWLYIVFLSILCGGSLFSCLMPLFSFQHSCA